LAGEAGTSQLGSVVAVGGALATLTGEEMVASENADGIALWIGVGPGSGSWTNIGVSIDTWTPVSNGSNTWTNAA